MTTYHGVAATKNGSAIVSLERTTMTTAAYCTAIERHGTDLAGLAERIRAIRGSAESRDYIVIDAGAGLGGALWKMLDEPARDGRYLAERSQGRARQAICDTLIAAVAVTSLTFAEGLAEKAAMWKALGTFRREVGDDGVLGTELATALAVGLHAPIRMPPRAY